MLLNVRNPRKKQIWSCQCYNAEFLFRGEGELIDRVESRQFFKHIKLFDIAFYVIGNYALIR